MVNIAIIGSGYWGINYVRVFSEIHDSKIVLVCDSNEDRLRAVRERYPLVATSTNWEEAITSRWVDAVVIATPANTHYEIAEKCLQSGKHVLVEKPIATRVDHAERLVQAAQEKGLVLMVGHTFLYNAGIRKVKELMAAESFGKAYYLHATRTNMGPIRSDVNAIWDLGSHDVAIINYLLDAQPEWVSAVGSQPFGNDRADVGFSTLHYPGGVIANIHSSWLDANKVRELVVVGSRRRIVFDDLKNVERVRIFEKGVAPEMEADTFGQFRLLVRDGDIVSPWIETSEPLRNLAAHFLQCVADGARPVTDGTNGLEVVRVMSAIDESLRQSGAPVKVVQ
jgi:predicted dehydrogenase